MKKELPDNVENGRIVRGHRASEPNSGPNGAFWIKGPKGYLNVIASNDEGWEHVSVSISKNMFKVPSWKEMCFVKDMFWEEDEWVIQYHPAKADYINHHPSTLHLWKPVNQDIPKPPPELV